MTQRLYWAGKSGISIGPHPNGEDLATAMQSIRDQDVDVVVSLQPLDEAKTLELLEEKSGAESQGMMFFRYPIIDHSTPPFTEETFALISKLSDLNAQGKRIFIHCYAGIGRSATIAACVLIARGFEIEDALQHLHEARGFAVPETQAQFNWIADYADMRRSDK